MKLSLKAAALAALMWFVATPALAQSLTTTYESNNGQNGNMFDLTPAVDLTVNSFDINLDAAAGTPSTIEIYWRAGTVENQQNNASGWTLLGSATVTSQGADNPTPVAIGGLGLHAGQTYGIYLRTVDSSLRYTGIGSESGPFVISNTDLTLTSFYGIGNSSPLFSGSTFFPRLWNGTVHYTLGIAPSVTCASEGYTGTKLTWCKNICEMGYTGATLNMWIRRWVDRYHDLPYCAAEPQPALQ